MNAAGFAEASVDSTERLHVPGLHLLVHAGEVKVMRGDGRGLRFHLHELHLRSSGAIA